MSGKSRALLRAGVVRTTFLLAAAALALAACATSGAPTPTASPTPTLPPPLLYDIPDAPPADLFDLAHRLRGADAAPLPDSVLYADEAPGSVRSFTGINIVDDQLFEFRAEALHVSDNAVWRFPVGAEVAQAQVRRAAREFEQRILPGVLELVAPGVALPGKIAIVHGDFPALGGYFNDADALPRAVYPASNERAALFINLHAGVGDAHYYGVLAHELQHLVHWLVDPTEDVWVQEGLSELAARSLGYPALPFDAYLRRPEVSLADWPSEPGQSLPNYAGAALFTAYLAERLGPGWPARAAAEPRDGAAGVEAAAPGDGFLDLYADWLVANVVNASSLPYGYDALNSRAAVRRTLRSPGSYDGSSPQLAPFYVELRPDGPWSVAFTPNPATPLLPVPAHSGGACWWSNRGESINSTLTRPVDLTAATSATLEFHAWWDIEEHWDHAHVAVSDDDGATWTVMDGELASTDNPFQTAFGPSYTGASGAWRRERVDLTPFAGNPILLRFEYVTDGAVNNAGWCVDDIAIDAVGFFDDAEADRGWTAEGFVRAGGRSVSQTFVLRLVQGDGNAAVVAPLPLNADGGATFRIDAPATLVVVPFAPKTTQPAAFTIAVSSLP